jgi:hypothetical protein
VRGNLDGLLSVVVAWVCTTTSLQSAVRVLGGMALRRRCAARPRAYWPCVAVTGAGVRFAALDAFGGLRQWGWIAALLFWLVLSKLSKSRCRWDHAIRQS